MRIEQLLPLVETKEIGMKKLSNNCSKFKLHTRIVRPVDWKSFLVWTKLGQNWT